MSPALELLDLVWRSNAKTSWAIINGSMQHALKLAIEGGFEFELGDFAHIEQHWWPGYWMGCDGMEKAYTRACAGPHGPNRSAVKAIEAHLKRKPFICPETAGYNDIPRRLYVGARFNWHESMAERVPGLTVTSFGTNREGVACVIACTYKDRGQSSERKVDRMFKITHADIAAYRKSIRDYKREWSKKDAEAAEERSLSSVVTT